MRLTPIRVRGKRKTGATATPTKRKREDGTVTSKRRQPRPVKKSLLERQLPFDVVESIFLYSGNVNFPRASPLLGRLLSGHRTLVAITVAAFSPTWDVTFGLTYGVVRPTLHPVAKAHGLPKLPNGEQLEVIPGDPNFQSAILASRWATIDVILEAQQLWARQTAKLRGIGFEGAAEDTSEDDSAPPKPRNGGLGRFDAHVCLAYDFDHVDGLKPFLPNDLYIDVHPEVRIPDALITGPWDEEMVRRLVWLRRAGALLDETQTWEVKLVGLKNAFPGDKPHPFLSQLIYWLFQRDDFFWNWQFDDSFNFIRFELSTSWPQDVLVSFYERLHGWAWSDGKGMPRHTIERIDKLMQYVEHALSHTGPNNKNSDR